MYLTKSVRLVNRVTSSLNKKTKLYKLIRVSKVRRPVSIVMNDFVVRG